MSEETPIDVQSREVEEIPASEVSEALPAQKSVLPAPEPLTVDEANFALALIEYGGNIGAAYSAVFGSDVLHPTAKGRELLNKANVALRVKSLQESVNENLLISVSSHLSELANIRDLAKLTGQIKIAYQAERSRGEAAGVYAKHAAGGQKQPTTAVQVIVNNKYDRDI